MSPRLSAAFVSLSFLVLAAPSFGSESYRLVDLGSLGGSHSCANAINNKGDIAGVSTLKGEAARHAVLWSGEKLTDLGTLDGFPCSDAIGISDAGFIVGEAYVPGGPMDQKRAVSWTAGKASALAIARTETPGGAAYDVNDAGIAVGRAVTGDPATRSGARASLLEAGKLTIIPQFAIGKAGTSTPEVATAVNRAGIVVGGSRASMDGLVVRRPFRFSKGVGTDPLLAFDPVSPSWAIDVNNAGDIAVQRIVGEADDSKGTWQPLIVKGEKVTVIAPLAGFANAEIRALNARGDAVGYSWNATGGTVPMIVKGGRSINPNEVLTAPSEWKVVLLTDLNDAGQVVGVATRGEETHAIRLDPGPSTGLSSGVTDVVTDTPTWTTAFAGARPNPSTRALGTQFAFTLASRGSVRITLTNVQGRSVRTLSGDFEAGPSMLLWDGRDDAGAAVGSGVVFARFFGGGIHDTRKVILQN